MMSHHESSTRFLSNRTRPPGAPQVLLGVTGLMLLLAATACQPPPFVTLEIGVDGQSVLEDVNTIGIGVASETDYRLSRQLTVADVNRLSGGELTVTVTSDSGSTEDLIVEGLAQRSGGAFDIVGRAFVTVNFGEETTKQVILRQPCDGDDHPARSSDVDDRCGDNLAVCNGRTQVCRSQVCQCPESFCGDSFTDVALGEECDDGNLNPNDGCDRCAFTAWSAAVVLGLGSSDGDPRLLSLDDPVDVAAGANDTIFVADETAGRVWRVQNDRVSLFAGNGRGVYSEIDEGQAAALAAIERPTAIAVDGFQRVFIAEGASGGFSARVRVVDERGIISTYAQTDAFVDCPNSLAADQDGTLYIGDCADVVWVVYPGAEQPERFAGNGEFGTPETIGDGGLATLAPLLGVAGVASDGRGRVFITEEFGNRIRVVENGRIATVVGNENGFGGFSGDGGAARNAQIDGPTGILVDADGSIVFADAYNFRIRAVGTDGIIRTLAGNGLSLDGLDGVLSTETSFAFPLGIARRSDGSLLVADNPGKKIRAIAPGTPLMSTVLGLGRQEVGGDGGLATSATFRTPAGLAASDGVLFIADPSAHRIRAVGFDDNIVRAVAGSGELDGRGESGLSGDGDAAVDAQLNLPTAASFSPVDGSLFVADQGNRRIRRVDANGKIESVVGGGVTPLPPTLQNAKEVLITPSGLDVHPDGRLFFGDINSGAIGVFNADTTVSRIAGTPAGEAVETDGPALSVRLQSPEGLFFDNNANQVVFADSGSHLIRAVDLDTDAVVTLAGGEPLLDAQHGDGYTPYLDFEGPATQAWLGSPQRVTTSTDGTIFVSDNKDHRVRSIGTDGTIRVIAGDGQGFFSGGQAGYNGDGIPGTSALLDNPEGLAVNGNTLYIADRFNHRIRSINLATGDIDTIAGNPASGTFGFLGGFSGDEGQALDAEFDGPSDVEFSAGTLYIADTGNRRVRTVNLTTGTVETLAGGGLIDPLAGPQANEANLTCPSGLAVVADTVYIAEPCVHRVWKVDALSGNITHVAGTGAAGSAGDGGPARAARLQFPVDLDISVDGNIFIADNGNHRVRVITPDGRIRSFTAPTAWPSYTGDNGPASEARLAFPTDVHALPNGTLLISDSSNGRIRKVSSSADGSTITTVAGAAAPGDGGPANAAILDEPRDVISDGNGGFYIADTGHFVVRHVDNEGVIQTVAGTGDPPSDGVLDEGSPGIDTRLTGPTGLELRGDILYISDQRSERVRALHLTTGILQTAAGLVDPGSGAFSSARLDLPNAMVLAASGVLVAQGDGRVRLVDEVNAQVRTVIGTDGATEANSSVSASQARLFRDAAGLAFDAANNTLYVTERDGHGIRKVTMEDPNDEETWVVSDFAGAAETPNHLDGPLDRARFRNPAGLAFDPASGALLVADAGNHVVRAIDLETRIVTTVLGVPEELGDATDNARANTANLNSPQAVAVAEDGTLFVADTRNNVVRRVKDGLVTRVLGDGQNASSGEGRPSRNFPVDAPLGLRLDSYGNLFVTSRTALRVVVANGGIASGDSQVLTVYGNNGDNQFPQDVTRCLSDVIITGPIADDLSTAESDAELASLTAGDDRVLIIDACQGMLIDVSRRRPAIDGVSEDPSDPQPRPGNAAEDGAD